MSISDDDLQTACFELARTAKWSRKPYDAELLSSLAAKFEEICRGFVEDSLGRDLPLIVKAIRYLGQVHALPIMDDDTHWLYSMLSVVVEIARPNTIVDERGKPFLEEMKKGIDHMLNYEA